MLWKSTLAAAALSIALPLSAHAGGRQCPCPPPGFIIVCPHDAPHKKHDRKKQKPAPVVSTTTNVTNNITNNTYNWNVTPPSPPAAPLPASPPAETTTTVIVVPDDGVISYYLPPRISDGRLAALCPNLSPNLRGQILNRDIYPHLYKFSTLFELGEDQLSHEGSWGEHSCEVLANPNHPNHP